MYSKHHAALSVAVGAGALVVLPQVRIGSVAVPSAALLAYAVALGVFVDLDHFLIARYRTGSWAALRFCLRNPTAAFASQDRIFDPGDVGTLHRLLSHLLVAGVLVLLLSVASVSLAALTAVVLYAHLVSDVVWDLHRLRAGRDVSVPESSE